LFHAVSFRSAGFVLTPMSQITVATIIIMIILGFIGSSPGSTGSGVKITSFVICLAAIKSVIFGRTHVHLAGRRIALDQILKAFSIIILSIFWILMTTFLLAINETTYSLLELLLEASSAFTNLGISAGITEHLSTAGKYIILINMIIGRIGSLAFILALAKGSLTQHKLSYSYPEERVLLE